MPKTFFATALMSESNSRRINQFHLSSETFARILFWGAWFLPTVLALMRSGGNGRAWESLLWSACICALLAILPRRLFRVAQYCSLLLTPALLWWIAYAALNGIGPGWQAALAATATSVNETKDALKLAIDAPYFVFFSLVCVASLVVSFYLYTTTLAMAATSAKTSEGLKLIFALALLPFAYSYIVSSLGAHLPIIFLSSDSSFSTIGSATRLVWEGVDQVLYGDILYAGHSRLPAKVSVHVKAPRLAMFVVGESVRAGGIGIEKIERGPWTKALNERVNNHLGVWLPTTCAGSNGTAVSVPMLITETEPSNYKQSATAPSVLAMLKAAGYKTAWISNQDTNVFSESGHDYYWTISRSAGVSDSYDEEMLPIASAFISPLRAQQNAMTTPYAMVLHMHGSHFSYQERYPVAEFAKEPENLSSDDLTELRYERSEECGAKVIVKLAALLDSVDYPAFLVFSGDHGENLSSDHNGVLTHLGPRATIRDGTTTSFVLWNRAMQLSAAPDTLLRNVINQNMIAHVDIAKIFLTLSGFSNDAVTPAKQVTILAPVEVGAPAFTVNDCSLLKP